MKKIFALLLTASMTVALFGCAGGPAETTFPDETTIPSTAPMETTIPETTVPETTLPQAPAESVCLDQMIEGSDITITREGETILLSEDGLTVELATDSLLVYRDGFVAAVMKSMPVIIGGNVYVHEDFYTGFLCKEDDPQPSLFHGVLFFPEEILSAIEAPDASAFNQKVAAEVMLPTSMGIEAPHVDMDRVFQATPLAEYPEILAAELAGLGYADASAYTYSEYAILSGAQALAQAGISNSNETTVAEYTQRQRSKAKQQFIDGLSEEEKAFAAEKQITFTDLAELQKAYPDGYMDRSDDSLKSALEGYYATDIAFLRDMNDRSAD